MGSLSKMKVLVLLLSSLCLLSPGQATAVSSATCDLCIAVVEGLENFITDDTTMDQILAKVEEICSSLGALEGLCIQIIEGYLPDIISGILENKLDPKQICALIGLCDGDETTVTPTTEPAPWVYIETMLEGGTVLTVEPDGSHVWMSHKHGKDNQLWRLEESGCLRVKSHMDRCLGIGDNAQGAI